MFAYFPGKDPTPETAALWAVELLPYELEDGMEAAKVLGSMGKFMPSLSEYIDGIREERNHRIVPEPALPSYGDLLMAASPVDDIGAPPGWPRGGAVTLVEFLRSRPDMADRVKKLGVWKQTLANLESDGGS